MKPVGAGHSFTSIAATDDIRLSLSNLRGLSGVDTDRKQVTLYAGTHLHEIPGLLAPHGLAMANLGDIDRQTISGAISTGTHGTGLGFGGIATQIVGATIVTPGVPEPVTDVVAGPVTKGRSAISFVPGNDGGSPITLFRVVCIADGVPVRSVSGTAGPLVVTSLLAGTTYQCAVTARNAIGASTAVVVGLPV